ncbi:MAG TPA: SRPBCC domain-containing protein [Ignavibacteriaceae bacterium]|nr:SRPBCC domain-containing protein [Ignavibacteriaceae bacterium]
MSTPNKTSVNTDYKVVIEKVFNAPIEKVFNAWIDEKIVSEWFSPNDFIVSYCKINPVPGGSIRITMKGPDGKEYPNRGNFVEIVDNEKIVFTTALLDDKGLTLIEDFNTVTFQNAGKGKTKVLLNAQVIKTIKGNEQYIEGMDEGWKQTIDKLEIYLNK